MKIYTKTGDDGTTGVFGSGRVSKNDPRIECYGTVDELNAVLGWAGVSAPDNLRGQIHAVQEELFIIGSHLACPDPKHAGSLPMLEEAAILRLENEIDQMEATLSPLRNFILPGGSELAARLHLARAVCRRAERLVVGFAASHQISRNMIVYLNRLSDWLFVQARGANQASGMPDIPWRPR